MFSTNALHNYRFPGKNTQCGVTPSCCALPCSLGHSAYFWHFLGCPGLGHSCILQEGLVTLLMQMFISAMSYPIEIHVLLVQEVQNNINHPTPPRQSVPRDDAPRSASPRCLAGRRGATSLARCRGGLRSAVPGTVSTRP